MIVTVTPNPSIDRTLEIDRLERGALIRAKRSTAEAAGKGVNVSCALTTQGIATVAALPLAEDSAATYLGLLAGATPIAPVPIAGSIRTNVSLVEADGTVTKVNEPGPALGAGDIEALPIASNTASGAFGSFSFQHLPRPQFHVALLEVRRVLRRGGLVELWMHGPAGTDGASHVVVVLEK